MQHGLLSPNELELRQGPARWKSSPPVLADSGAAVFPLLIPVRRD
jgi:hypothetical protein